MKLDFERLFASAPSPFVLVDRELRMLWANEAYLQVTGRSRESIIGRLMTEEFPSPPEITHGRMLRASFERVFRTGQPDHLPLIPYPIADESGRVVERYWSATNTPIAGPDGRTAFVLQNTHDVTDLYRSEHGTTAHARQSGIVQRAEAVTHQILELDSWTQFFRTAFSQAPTFMAVLTGPNHVFQIVNDAYLQIVGHRRDPVGRSVRDALPEIEGQGFFELLDQVYRTGEAVTLRGERMSLMRDEGPEELYLDFVYQPLSGPDGSSIGIFVQGQDVTAQRQAEVQLRDAEERFRTLAQTMPSQAWTANPGGGLDWLSDRVYAFTGLKEGDLYGSGWLEVVHPDDRDRVVAAWTEAIRAGETYETEFRIRRADGRYLWHLVRAAPVHGEDGSVVRWVGTNTDFDGQKATEAALAELNATLEERVAERNRELEEMSAALRHSQKLEAIGTLAGGIAHDFNNLLQAITGSLTLASRELQEGSVARKRLLAAMGSVERAAMLSSQLLAFSRRQALDPKAVDLHWLLRDMDYLLRSAVGEKIDLQIDIAPDAWPAFADPANTESAILNLVVNARDAMDGRGTLRIQVENRNVRQALGDVQPGEFVEITVSDDGPGMSPEVAEKAFEPFFTTKPVGKGTGLGLSTVYGFAKQSGGRAVLRTAPGEGTSVTLWLPRSAEMPEPMAVLTSHSASRGDERILLVEDDSDVRSASSALLSDLGYAITEAASADAAMEILRTDAMFDLILTDVVMPGKMTAVELAGHAQARWPGLPVLFSSGYSRDAIVRNERIEAGRHFLSKPYTQETLARKVRELLDAAGEPAVDAASFAPEPPPPGSDRALRVLVCEDETLVLMDLLDMLTEAGAAVSATAKGAEAIDRLAAGDFDLMITDVGLPDMSGEDLARRAREMSPGLPLIFATGHPDVDLARSLANCAVLSKPFRDAAVLAAMQRVGVSPHGPPSDQDPAESARHRSRWPE